MIKHLFKLIWNQKRKNALLTLEIFISFLVLFAVLSTLLYQYLNLKSPMGFDYERVWVANLDIPIDPESTEFMYQQALESQLGAFQEIEHLSFSNFNVPFSLATNSSTFEHNGVMASASVFTVDDNYHKVLNIDLQAGRWFDMTDTIGKYRPIIITEHLRQELFGEGAGVGEILEMGSVNCKVLGVISHFKYRDFEEANNSVFIPIRPSNVFQLAILMKIKEGVGIAFESVLSKTISNIVNGRQNEINQIAENKKTQFQVVFIPMIILLIVCCFLIFNVILGLFGILWYNINKRKNEIGLRRALGATQGSITRQFIVEIIFVATLGIALGVFFGVQFPILQVFGIPAEIYIWAIVISSLLIYGIVMICAFYPSWQASKIHPALALHQD